MRGAETKWQRLGDVARDMEMVSRAGSFCVSGSSRGHFFEAQGGSDLPPSYCSEITHWLKIQF